MRNVKDEGKLGTIKTWFSHAFAIPPPSLEDADRELIDRVAGVIVKRQMVLPALMTLETVRPLGGIGSAAMTFLAPYLTFALTEEESRRIACLLETKIGIDYLIERVEKLNTIEKLNTHDHAQ